MTHFDTQPVASKLNQPVFPLVYVGLAFLGSVLLVLYPMLWHQYLPLVDTPNHIARQAVVAQPDGPLSTYYEVSPSILAPNSAIDLLWQLTGMNGDPVSFTRTTMMIYAVNLVLSVMVLNRIATGRWHIWPAVAGLLVYNGNFFWGFQNYVFTIPFSIHALSLWLVLERRPIPARILAFLPIGALLFVMHLLALVLLAVAVFGREVHRLLEAGKDWPRQMIYSVASGVPLALPLLYYIHQTLTQPAGELGNRTDFGGVSQRLRTLLSIQWEYSLSEIPALRIAALIAIFLLAICFLTTIRRSGARLRIAHRLKGPIIAVLVLSLVTPSWLNGVALIHIRFPFVFAALLFAGSYWVDVGKTQMSLLFAVILTLAVQKAVQFEKYWAMHNTEMHDLQAVLSEIPPGSRLLPLRADGHEGLRRLWHVQAYATTYNDVFIPTFFQGSHTVDLKPQWTSFATAAYRPVEARRAFIGDTNVRPGQNAYWLDWEKKFTHVLFLDRMPASGVDDSKLEQLASVGRFQLLRVRAAEER